VIESGHGARFIRADLHVHSFPDDGSPAAAPKDYITEARSQDISVLGITDHNSIANVRSFIEAASGQLLVLPGIEVTTHQGHLLALFGPDRLDALQAFATRENLKLADDRASKVTRSSRSNCSPKPHHVSRHVDSRCAATPATTRATPAPSATLGT
jgi:hypothetical protein